MDLRGFRRDARAQDVPPQPRTAALHEGCREARSLVITTFESNTALAAPLR